MKSSYITLTKGSKQFSQLVKIYTTKELLHNRTLPLLSEWRHHRWGWCDHCRSKTRSKGVMLFWQLVLHGRQIKFWCNGFETHPCWAENNNHDIDDNNSKMTLMRLKNACALSVVSQRPVAGQSGRLSMNKNIQVASKGLHNCGRSKSTSCCSLKTNHTYA